MVAKMMGAPGTWRGGREGVQSQAQSYSPRYRERKPSPSRASWTAADCLVVDPSYDQRGVSSCTVIQKA